MWERGGGAEKWGEVPPTIHQPVDRTLTAARESCGPLDEGTRKGAGVLVWIEHITRDDAGAPKQHRQHDDQQTEQKGEQVPQPRGQPEQPCENHRPTQDGERWGAN